MLQSRISYYLISCVRLFSLVNLPTCHQPLKLPSLLLLRWIPILMNFSRMDKTTLTSAPHASKMERGRNIVKTRFFSKEIWFVVILETNMKSVPVSLTRRLEKWNKDSSKYVYSLIVCVVTNVLWNLCPNHNQCCLGYSHYLWL